MKLIDDGPVVLSVVIAKTVLPLRFEGHGKIRLGNKSISRKTLRTLVNDLSIIQSRFHGGHYDAAH